MRRTVVRTLKSLGGACSAGLGSGICETVWPAVAICRTHATIDQSTVLCDVVAISCGCSLVRNSIRQQPCFTIWLHLLRPVSCITRQQALSSGLIARLVVHASAGKAAVKSNKSATRLARRRIPDISIVPGYDCQ